MAKSRRASRRSKKSRRHSRRNRRLRGGVAPVGYDLAQEVMAKSLQQGQQYAQYHAEQHGGSADYQQALSGQSMLSDSMKAPAMQDGPLSAYQQIQGMKDPSPADIKMSEVTGQTGGRKRRGSRKGRKSRKGRSRKQRRQQRKQQQGGGYGMPPLGYDSVNAPGLLLSQDQYEQAGLNPRYFNGTSVEQIAAGWRDNA